MNCSLKHLAAATLILASLSSFATPAYANITQQQSAEILKTFGDAPVTDFRQFLGGLAKSDLAKTDNLDAAINAFLGNKALAPEQQNDIHRLLGIYARVKYACTVAAPRMTRTASWSRSMR